MDTTPPRLRRAYFECRHGQLHVHNAIPVGGGFDELTTLICLHGATGTGRMFLELSKRLGSSRSIYSPDLPGCGESDAATEQLSIAGFAEAVADFLDSMRFRQVDLLGVGAGGAVAAELAVARPKVVRKLGLLGTPGKETVAGAGAQDLHAAATQLKADRRQLVKQPVLALEGETGAESVTQAFAGRLAEFLDGN
jgi:pimeloyl-ACP methyl ester carboxylesterase